MNVFNDKTEIALCILHIHVIIAVVCMQLTCFFLWQKFSIKSFEGGGVFKLYIYLAYQTSVFIIMI